jgi:hypothetical protein
MDGASGQTIRLGQAQIETDPPVESLQEVRVLTNAFSAEYGGTASGVVVMNTKSGTNQMHGTLFEYFRNEQLDAANFFAPWVNGEKERAPIRYNVFGGTLGGPIVKNKAFYFGSYEGSRRRDGLTQLMTVPSLAERTGNYAQTFNANGTLAVVYDPASSTTPETRKAFPGNVIPVNRHDRVSIGLMPYYPTPNRTADNVAGTNNFGANTVDAVGRDTVSAKGDYNHSDANRFSGRLLWQKQADTRRSAYPDPAAEPSGNRDSGSYNILGSWTRIVSPAVLNELRGAYLNRSSLLYSPSYGLGYPTKLGIKGIPDDAFPRFQLTGYDPLGSNNQLRDQAPIEQYHLLDTLSWITGRHSIRFGGEARLSRNRDLRLQQVSGQFTFNRGLTGLPNRTTTGNTVASLLLGSPSTYRAARPPVVDRSSWYLAGYVQDDWQIHPDVGLNLGMRWEFDTPFRTQDDIMNGFDMNTINPVSKTPGVVKFAGIGGYPVTPHEIDWNNFGPRVGLAWKPMGNAHTVVRAAYGIFFAGPYDGAEAVTSLTTGYGTSLVIPTDDSGSPVSFRLSDPIPVVPVTDKLDDSFGAVPVGTSPYTEVRFYERDRATGYSQQINFRIQRELPGQLAVEAGYIANLSRKMPSPGLSLNQIPPWMVGPGTAAQNRARRPFPQFSNVLVEGATIGIINYHAFAMRAEKRFARGMNLLATYTYAKNLDNTDSIQGLGDEGGPYSNFYNRRADYGPSTNDIRQRLTWSSVYQIPYGRGRRWGSNNLAGAIFGNWSVSAVFIMQTAPPFTVRAGSDTTSSFAAGALRADVLRDPNLPAAQRSLKRWFDTDAFRQPAPYLFGNQGVNILRGDGRVSLNASILRDFPITEGVRMQLRGESFNVMNHANFGTPGAQMSASAFGVVDDAATARQIQLGLRLVF